MTALQAMGVLLVFSAACTNSNTTEPLKTEKPVCSESCVGPTGPTGEMGPQGLPGTPGAAGAAGAPGQKGDKGDTGPQGIQGATGAMGPMGPAGAPGQQGPSGNQGPVGPTGSQGQQGVAGPTGPSGAKGATGSTGSVGPQGPSTWIELAPSSNASPVIVGTPVPLFSGMGIFMTESNGSTGIPNFPEGLVVGTQPTTLYTACNTSGAFVAKSDHILTNQLVWSVANNTQLYKMTSGNPVTVTCGGTSFVAFQVILTSYTFNPIGLGPWTMVLQ